MKSNQKLWSEKDLRQVRNWGYDVSPLLAYIDALKERCELLAVTLVDHTEWTTWVPSADGTGEWARRRCGLCGGEMAAEGDRLPHKEDCLLADLEGGR